VLALAQLRDLPVQIPVRRHLARREPGDGLRRARARRRGG
jgi:hypothetical protein